MKFLLVSPFTSTSGSAIRFWNIAHQLQLHGFKVVYVERAPKDSPPPLFQNITYYRSPKLKSLYLDIIVSLIFNLSILVRHFDCSIYYALKPAPNNCIPALVAKLSGKRIFLDIDDLDFGYLKPGIKRNISRFFFHLFPKYFGYITCHTENIRKYILETLKIPEKKVYFITQGVSDPFLEFKLNERLKHINKSIVYLATLGITSDLQDLIPMFNNICTIHPDLKITIIGDGVKKNFYKKEIATLGLDENIDFIGRVEHHMIPQVMGEAQIGLNYMKPSFTNNCRAILKIREYLAVGLQVVCNDAGDANIFKDYIYIEKDIKSIEQRLASLLKKDIPVNVKGREFIEINFRWDTIIDNFLKKALTS